MSTIRVLKSGSGHTRRQGRAERILLEGAWAPFSPKESASRFWAGIEPLSQNLKWSGSTLVKNPALMREGKVSKCRQYDGGFHFLSICLKNRMIQNIHFEQP